MTGNLISYVGTTGARTDECAIGMVDNIDYVNIRGNTIRGFVYGVRSLADYGDIYNIAENVYLSCTHMADILSASGTIALLTAGDQTPSVGGVNLCRVANTAATSIYNFDDGIMSQSVWVIDWSATGTNTTLMTGVLHRYLHFTAGDGGTAPLKDDTISQGAASATIEHVNLRDGAWADGDGEGDIYITGQTGTFAAGTVTCSTGATFTITANSDRKLRGNFSSDLTLTSGDAVHMLYDGGRWWIDYIDCTQPSIINIAGDLIVSGTVTAADFVAS